MQQPPIEKLQELSDKWLKGTITDEELELLEEWYNNDTHDEIYWDAGDADADQLHDRLFYNIKQAQKAGTPVYTIIGKSKLYKIAAMLIVMIGGALYYYTVLRSSAPGNVPDKNVIAKKREIQPDANKAILTLANGDKVILDNADNGLIAKEGNTRINKTHKGELTYNENAGPANPAPEINSISTPSGGQYEVGLPDGSKVWLNTLSSLKFPTAFTGNERVVELTGEAYFEIAKNEKMPFKIKLANNIVIQDIGTHFDVMAYANESSIKATLLEGAISVNKGNISKLMAPGQEADITDNIRLTEVNADEAISWKNGLFSFDGSDIQTVMRQIERWYDVQAIYEGGIPVNKISGYIPRSASLQEVLKMLELSGLTMTTEGKKIKIFNQSGFNN